MKTYRKTAVVSFAANAVDPNRHLSNLCGSHPLFWPMDKEVAQLWCSTEQLYQSSKYGATDIGRHPNKDTLVNLRTLLRRQRTPLQVRRLQGRIKSPVRSDWASSSAMPLAAMKWVLELKLYFNAHRPFGRELLKTGRRAIVAVCPDDDYWGAKEVKPGILVGHNHLGRLLMEVRNNAEAILAGELTHPDGFLPD